MKKLLFPVIIILLLLLNTAAIAQPIQVRIPANTSTVGNFVDVPVYVDNSVTGLNVYAYQLRITYNSSQLTYNSIVIAGAMVQPWGGPIVNSNTAGTLIMAGAGSAPLTGTGVLLYMRFQCIASGSSNIAFNGGTASNFFNEGTPVMTLVNGSINIAPLPSITISPNTALLSVGETQQFTVSGGTAPYTWEVKSPALATISSTGLLNATAPGFTLVSVTDNNGIIDLTDGNIEIRALKLTLPAQSGLQGTVVEVPINVTSVNGLGIVSGNLAITFNQIRINAIGFNTVGTLLSGYSDITFNNSLPGTLQLAFAGTVPLTGSGVLVYLRFLVSSENTGSSALNFTTAEFNESMLAKTVNGSFAIIPLPVITVTPATFTLVAGETKQFAASGGTAPYNWNTSNNSLATINSTGLLSALSGGIVQVTATDQIGATGTSGDITIYDTYVSVASGNGVPLSFFDVPVTMGTLPAGKSVYSVQGTISYKSPELTAIDIITTGTMTNGWTFAKSVTGNKITFAGAGNTSFSNPGTMFLVRFQLNASLTVGEVAYVNIDNILLNEGDPSAKTQNGSITGGNPLTETISIPAGWSGISSYLIPVDTDLPDMFASVLPNLVMIKNFTNVYSPPLAIPPSQPWEATSGYYIKMSAPVNLVISGSQNPQKMLALKQGWNIIPVNNSSAVNCTTLLAGVNFMIIQEVAGTKMYWPSMAISTLSTLQPGKSYLIYMNAAGTITFP